MPTAAPTRIPIANRILTALPQNEYEQLRPNLETVTLAQGEIIYNQGATITHYYFPTSGAASLVTISGRGSGIEVAIVGSEGVLGLPAAFGSNRTLFEIIMHVSGEAVRTKASVLEAEFRHHGVLQDRLMRYNYALVAQISQTAFCNRFHTVEQRLCRWLLMTSDRVKGKRFHLTQEFLSYLVGSRRQGVNQAMRCLQKREVIRYVRGLITIVNQEALEASSCDCCRVIKDAYAMAFEGSA